MTEYDQTLSGTYLTGPASAIVDSNGAAVSATTDVAALAVVEVSPGQSTMLCPAVPQPRSVTIINMGNGPIYLSPLAQISYRIAAPGIPIGIAVHVGETKTVVTASAIYAASVDTLANTLGVASISFGARQVPDVIGVIL